MYYTIEALIKDNRVLFRWKKPYKKVFLCSTNSGDFILQYKGNNIDLYGYSEHYFKSCILDYENINQALNKA